MATYAELKVVSNSMVMIKSKDLLSYDIDSFAEHLPSGISRANDAFVSNNHGLTGLLDYDEHGFTEPEDERDCYANNQALSRLDEVMPYLEKINQYLPEGYTERSDYSLHVLHLADEILAGKDNGLSEEQLDFLCERVGTKDYQYFGCKHHEYDACDARRRLEAGTSIEDIKKFQEVDSLTRMFIDFYTDDCARQGKDVDNEAINLIVSAYNSDEAAGLHEILTSRDDMATVDQAKAIHEAIGLFHEAVSRSEVNPTVTLHWEDGDTSEVARFSPSYDEGVVRSFNTLIHKGYPDDKRYYNYFTKNPEKILDFAKDFIKNGGHERWISDYYEANPDKFEALLPESEVNSVSKTLPRKQKEVGSREVIETNSQVEAEKQSGLGD